MLFPALFRALRGTAEWIQNEDRHPRAARLSRRAFGKLIGAVVLLNLVRPAGVQASILGECSECNGHHCPKGCMIRTGRCPPVGNVGPSPTGSVQETVRGVIDLTIGQAEGDERYLFGRILGLALDARGRVYVSDRQIGSVRGYGSTGEFLFQMGRIGGGPLEYRRYPSSIAILPDGHLWIASFEDKVLRADPTKDDVAASLEEVRVESVESWLYDGLLALDADGNLVASGFEPVRRDYLRRRRISLRDGRTVSKANPWALQPTPEEMGWRLSPNYSRAEIAEAEEWNALGYLYGMGGPPPYGTNRLLAFSTGGRVALAVTTTYRVNVYDSRLRPVMVIERDEEGPRLTDAERRNTSARMAERRRDEEYYPYGDGDIPDRKPPLRDLWFDRDGRLWLERYLAGEPQRQGADVYGVDGEFLFAADWPRGVDFSLGAIRGDTGLGIQTDALGIPRVVRVRFGTEIES